MPFHFGIGLFFTCTNNIFLLLYQLCFTSYISNLTELCVWNTTPACDGECVNACVLEADRQRVRGDQWKAVSAQSSLLHCVSIFTPYYHIINAEDPIGLTLKTLARRGVERREERQAGDERKDKNKV